MHIGALTDLYYEKSSTLFSLIGTTVLHFPNYIIRENRALWFTCSTVWHILVTVYPLMCIASILQNIIESHDLPVNEPPPHSYMNTTKFSDEPF